MLSDLRFRLRSVFRRRAMERELQEELNFHLVEETRKHQARGMTESEARRQARIGLGGMEQVKEECRSARGMEIWDTVARDLVHALWMMRREPGFTIAALGALALGIGAGTAVFSVVNGVLLRPLPYADPDQLVNVSATLAQAPRTSGLPSRVRDPGLPVLALTGPQSPFAGVATGGPYPYVWTGGDEAQRLAGYRMSANLFDVLGVSAWRGRVFAADDEQPGRSGTVVVSYDAWMRRFHADPAMVGQVLTLDAAAYTVIGVMPRGFQYPPYPVQAGMSTELWTVIPVSANEKSDPNRRVSSVVARLNPGITRQAAQSVGTALVRQLESAIAPKAVPTNLQVASLRDAAAILDVRPALWMLLAAVSLVLLVGCANVANLQLARAAARGKEFAVRIALGAGKARLLSQLLTESMVLAMLAGLLGVMIAVGACRVMAVLLPASIPRREEIAIDGYVLLFAVAASVVTGIVTGVIPALRASYLDPIAAARGTAGTGAAKSGNWIANAFIVTQIAVSTLLLSGSGLLIDSFVKLVQVRPGFGASHVLTADFDLGRGFGPVAPAYRYGQASRVKQFYGDLLARVGAAPGVERAATISGLPIWADSYRQTFPVHADGAESAEVMAGYYTVSPGIFDTLGIPLVRGRGFTDRDTEDSTPVAVVSQALAERLFGDADPIGRRTSCGPLGWRTIVGVVGDVRVRLDVAPPPLIYGAYSQMPERYAVQFGRYLTTVVRTAGDPRAVAPMVREQIHALDPALPVNRLETMDNVIADAVAPRRFYMLALGVFALAALAMASAGVYGIVAYGVQQQTREIGVRVALGAEGHDVLWLMLKRSVLVAAMGLPLGVFAARSLTRYLAAQLYGITATDLGTFIVASAVLAAVVGVASYVPARRACRIDPVQALRFE